MAALDEPKKWESDGAALEDSNVANIGSAEDKAARKAAALNEPAWEGCGQAPGVEIWRIEQFKVISWPKEEYGSFYDGDSYICLKTTKDPESEKLEHDIHFWLGASTSQDEMGTAAYKTVELDDFMDGEPTQHREVQNHESSEFQNMFGEIKYLSGGVESGFNHVEPDAYIPKLLQVRKTKRTVKVTEVPLARGSLNEGDCFILDAGAKIFTWFGSGASSFEKNKCNASAEAIENTRLGRSVATAINDTTEAADLEQFWSLLGGEGEIKSAEEADRVPVDNEIGEGILFKLSDASGSLVCAEVARGDLTTDMLGSEDVYLVDTMAEIFVWTGDGASDYEKRSGIKTALQYLEQNGRPSYTPITCFKEGKKIRNDVWNGIFSEAPSETVAMSPASLFFRTGCCGNED